MKVGIIGSGPVGKALALGFEKHDYPIVLGSRSMDKLNEWKVSSGFKGKLGTYTEAAEHGDMLVLAVPAYVAEEVLEAISCDLLFKKIIIDATNPISKDPPEKGVLKFFTTLDSSFMEALQKKFASSKFVKAFNSIGSADMVNPDFNGQKPTMFICGNDATAKNAVKAVLVQFGFEVEDMGAVEAARAIEPLCMLWCIPGFIRNEWSHAFKLLKK